MSQRTVIGTVKSCLQSDTYGLAAMVRSLAAQASRPDRIRDDFSFADTRLPSVIPATTSPSVGIRPMRWDAGQRNANLRDGVLAVEVRVEYFDADAEIVKENADLCADALALVIDGLREFSDLVGGPVIEVLGQVGPDEPMLIVITGDFENPASSGFLATFRVEERTVYV